MSLSRRQFFTLAGTSAAGVVLMSPLEALYNKAARGQLVSGGGYGPLIPDSNGLLDLPKGFQYRAFSRTGDIMNDGNPVPGGHDGMGAFPGPNNTTILVRNHELSPNSTTQVAGLKYDNLCKGGTTTLIVGPNRQLQNHFASLAGTYRNCAGGTTPWGSWISSEENTSTPATNDPVNTTGNVEKRHGYNFEVPANAKRNVVPVPLKAMGRFNHEAVAVDPKTGIVYETEDKGDSLFYRFIPNQPGNLVAGGVLEALKIKGMPQAITKTNFPVRQPKAVEWVRIDNPDPDTDTVRVEGFGKGAAQFSRGEGIWYGSGEFYFCCTNGGAAKLGQVWRYVPGKTAQEGGTLELFVEPNNVNVLDSPDNIVVAPFGDLILCEDGDDEQFVVGVTPKGELYQFARNAINDNEFAGACFSPDGNTMFVNIQTPGITFAVWGPWAKGK
ncbi:alkaline phosphatase PhoX [Coleofasciculus sp. H7-2]|uniref:alkaline phosphatase PhoX n=1 Tax=Coleofasciculus sp. H7-2 TaxID=3351545 RepID=UPI003670FF37